MTLLCDSDTWADAVGRAYAKRRPALLGYLWKLGVRGENGEDALQNAVTYVIGKPNDPARAADLLRGACLLMSRRHHQQRRARGGSPTIAEIKNAEIQSATNVWTHTENARLTKEKAEDIIRSLMRCPIGRAIEVMALRADEIPCKEIAEILGLGRGASTVRAKIWKIRDWVRRDINEMEQRR